MNRNRAFTLIELLVVIAIIAILAAILFPVFAQAKAAAKGVADLSNIKQIGTAMAMYTADYDDRYSYGIPDLWSGAPQWGSPSFGWTLNLQPYSKSLALFRSPLETSTQDGSWGTWEGTAVSYGLNGFTVPNSAAAVNMQGIPPDQWQGRCFHQAYTDTQDCTLRGIAAPYAQVFGDQNRMNPPGGELNTAALTVTVVTHPGDTVAFATKYDADALRYSAQTQGNGQPAVGNDVQFQCGGIFEEVPTTDGSEGSNTIDWCGGGEIPNGLKAVSTGPRGAYGAVSQIRQGLSNFSMVDTHAKALTITSTNPSPDTHPELNKWDALRP